MSTKIPPLPEYFPNNVVPFILSDDISALEMIQKLNFYVRWLIGQVDELNSFKEEIEGLDLENKLTEITTKLTELENQMSDISSDLSKAQEDIIKNAQDIASNLEKINSNIAEISNIKISIESINVHLTAIDNSITNINNSITNLINRVSTNEENIIKNSENIGKNKIEIDNIKTEQIQQNDNISNLQNSITDINNKLDPNNDDSLAKKVAVNTVDIANIKAEQIEQNTAITELQSQTDPDLKNKVNQNTADIAIIKEEQNEQNAEIEQLKQEISGISPVPEGLVEQVNTNKSDIAAIKIVDERQDSDISILITDNANNKTVIQTLETKSDELESEVMNAVGDIAVLSSKIEAILEEQEIQNTRIKRLESFHDQESEDNMVLNKIFSQSLPFSDSDFSVVKFNSTPTLRYFTLSSNPVKNGVILHSFNMGSDLLSITLYNTSDNNLLPREEKFYTRKSFTLANMTGNVGADYSYYSRTIILTQPFEISSGVKVSIVCRIFVRSNTEAEVQIGLKNMSYTEEITLVNGTFSTRTIGEFTL